LAACRAHLVFILHSEQGKYQGESFVYAQASTGIPSLS
jgi:hypothetical protein